MKPGFHQRAGNAVNYLFIEKFKRIAAAHLALEIDGKAHDADIFRKRGIRDVTLAGCAIDRILNHALCIGHITFHRTDSRKRNPALFRVAYCVDVTPILCGEGKSVFGCPHFKADR